MKIELTSRGFELGQFEDGYGNKCSIQESSAIGEYEDAMDRPGSSFLWLGVDDNRMHLNREQVIDLVKHLQSWTINGTLNYE